MSEDIEYGWSCIKFSKKEKKEYQLLITANIKIFVTQRKKRQVASVFGSTLSISLRSNHLRKKRRSL